MFAFLGSSQACPRTSTLGANRRDTHGEHEVETTHEEDMTFKKMFRQHAPPACSPSEKKIAGEGQAQNREN